MLCHELIVLQNESMEQLGWAIMILSLYVTKFRPSGASAVTSSLAVGRVTGLCRAPPCGMGRPTLQ